MNTTSTDATQAELAQRFGADAVMPLPVWYQLAGVSASTGKRILKGKRGPKPKLTRMSERCQGVRVSHHHEWLETCSTHEPQKENPPGVTPPDGLDQL